jgi:PAS domain S-box-containing protein
MMSDQVKSKRKIRVLIVDDSVSQALVLEALLRKSGMVTELAHDGMSAFERFEQGQFDLVLTDVLMPGISGYELCRKIKAHPGASPVPVVLVTVLNSVEDLQEALRCGADNYIVKPYDRASIAQRIEKMVTGADAVTKVMEECRGKPALAEESFAHTIEGRSLLNCLSSMCQEYLDARNREQHSRLSEQEQRLQLAAIIESSHDAIVSTTLDGIVLSWNPAAEKLYGYSSAEVLGRSLSTLFPPDRTGEFDDMIARLNAGEAVRFEQAIRRHKSGDLLIVSVTYSPVRDASGKVTGISAIARDITEQRMLDAQRENLMGVLAHDLKNPLIDVNRLMTVLLDGRFGELNEDQRNVAKMVLKACEELLRMVQDILRLYRFEKGAHTMFFETVDLRPIVEQCLSDVGALADGHEIRLVCTMPKTLCQVVVDRTAIRHVLMNLLHNAIKFTPAGGRVELDLDYGDDKVFIRVTDSGPGIPIDEQERLFERLSQGELGRKFKTGTGLGLYLCHQIVRHLSGHLTCRSEPGKGTTFTIRLSCAPHSKNQPAAAAPHIPDHLPR